MAYKRMFECLSPRKKSNGGTYWHRVGTAFENDEGLITVVLDSYPLPDEDGRAKFSLFLPKERGEGAPPPQQGGRSQGRTGKPPAQQTSLREDLDDEIPF